VVSVVQGRVNDMAMCYIGLGSNLQHPRQQIQQALQLIDQLPKSQRLKTSNFYDTAPVGPQDQPDFVNAVTQIQTQLEPLVLLRHLQAIEQQQGRKPSCRGGPRVIDLDILLYGQQTIYCPELTIPHPRMWERAFVLEPLHEIAPELHSSL